MRALSVIAALGLALAAGCGGPARLEGPAGEADALLAMLHARGDFSGAAAISGAGIDYAAGFGTADGERPFTPATASDGGSLAKPVTAALALMLAAEGLMDLDAPAQRYIPDFPYPDVTVRALLAHAAPLPDYDAFEELLESGAPVYTSDLLAMAPLDPPPPDETATFRYCNLCYDALALAIEAASGERYDALLRARLFGPLGLRDSFVRPALFADWPGPRTIGYLKTEHGVVEFDAFDNEGFHGASNIYFSARDLIAWLEAWTAPQPGPLPVTARGAALEPSFIDGVESGLTLGNWYCADDRARCWYRGHHQGFHSFAYFDRARRLHVAFVSNNGLPPPLQAYLPRALVAIAEGRAPGDAPRADDRRPADAEAAAGLYRADGLGALSLTLTDEGAFASIDGGPRYPLYPVGYGMFYAPGLDAFATPLDHDGRRYARLRWQAGLDDVDAARAD